ncbi:MAG: SgcJ/EcaC family oxidoreductase [Ignavibacteriae bacterium]|nr:SgcJ/EcaC family oxidoreductase [Ignavibacteriota bacterium]
MDKSYIETMYKELLSSWNKQDAKKMASLFAEDGSVVGFNGSQMNGRAQIESEIGQIFSHHQTASFVGKTREIRFLSKDTALLRAVAGTVTIVRPSKLFAAVVTFPQVLFKHRLYFLLIKRHSQKF